MAEDEQKITEDSEVPAEETLAGAEEAVEAEAAAEPEAEETEAAEAAEEEVALEAETEAAEEKPAKKAAPKKAKKKAHVKAAVDVPAVKAIDSKAAGLSPDVFEIEPKVGVLHEVVIAELASRRQGNASTKRRGEVSGGGVKPWRQKGTGRARAGSSRMPHWTGGGIAFGPKPRDYSTKINRKVRSTAIRMALSARVREGGIRVVDGLPFDQPKSRAAEAVLAGLDINYPLLVLVDEGDTNAALSFRNLRQVGVTVASEVNVIDIMAARTVLMTKSAVDQLNARLGGAK